MQHHFNVEIAKTFGVDIAIFLDHMAFWITKNMANNHNFHDGAYWTRNTMEAYTILFPYWTTMKVRKVLRNCEKFGLINKGNYNETKYDRTGWYSLTEYAAKLLNISICSNEQMEKVKRTNGRGQKNKSIPCTNTVTNTERASGPKRLSLSDDFKFTEEHEQMCAEKNLKPKEVLDKFKAWMKSKGVKSNNWAEEAKVWILREKQELRIISNNHLLRPIGTESKSNVPWFGENH